MPSREWRLNATMEDYLTDVKKRTRNEVTVKKYRWMIGKVNAILIEGGLNPMPKKWTEDTVEYHRDEFEETVEMQVAQVEVLSTERLPAVPRQHSHKGHGPAVAPDARSMSTG